MKTNKLLFILPIILFSCSTENNINSEKITDSDGNNLTCNNQYFVGNSGSINLTLKASVEVSNSKNLLSNIGGNITTLNCEKGSKVSSKTLIAKIEPDYSDPSVQNLVNQKTLLNTQISNTNGIISSTNSNYNTQLNSLNLQKKNLEDQIEILNNSYSKLEEQKSYGVDDLDQQLSALEIQKKTLETQVTDLSNSKQKLEDYKASDLDKLNTNLINAKSGIETLISSYLLKIDEIYGISTENKDKNDDYDTYLSAKDEDKKEEIKNNWKTYNKTFSNFSNLTDEEISEFLQILVDFSGDVQDSLKLSIASSVFTQNTIDGLYSGFVDFETNLVSSKNSFDDIVKGLNVASNSYDTQILAIVTQINAANNNIESVDSSISNLKSNKVGTFTTSIDIQINELESNIKSSKTSLENIIEQIKALNSQKDIQIKQLNSQLTELKSSLKTVEINLGTQSIYAGVDGTIKSKPVYVGNKVSSNTTICEILPNESSLKLEVYSSNKLEIPAEISFEINSQTYTTKLITLLPYQDSLTQNYIYETSSDFYKNGELVDISDIISDGKVLDVNLVSSNLTNNTEDVYIPLEYLSNTINYSSVKQKTSTGVVVNKNIVLGELNSQNINIKSGLKNGDIICK